MNCVTAARTVSSNARDPSVLCEGGAVSDATMPVGTPTCAASVLRLRNVSAEDRTVALFSTWIATG